MLGDQMDIKPLEHELNELELNPKPEYINMDRKDREAFLSQIGNFSTEERGIFNMLCDNWEHEIGYAKFVTNANKKTPIEEKDLQSLMKKLRKSSCGILLTKFERGERGVEKIILTDVRSHHFYYYFINNEYQKNYEEVSNDFVDDKRFDKYDIITTELSPQVLNIDELNKRFIEKEHNLYNIFSIKPGGYTPFYATSYTLKDLLKLSVRKVKYYFKSDNFIAFIAKIMNTSISKVRSTTDRFEISTWKELTRDILSNKSIINGKFKNISSSFFKAIIIANSYCNNELKQRDKELQEENKIKEILKGIVNIIREKEFAPMSQEDLNSLFEDFNKENPNIKSKFYELYVDNKTKTGLTDIIFIGQHYIHKDNLYKVFLDRIGMITVELTSYFVDEYKKCLLSNSSDPSLLEGYPFNGSVMTKLQSDYPIIYDILKRKGILAEAIIHFSKNRGHSQSKMHNLLSMYFIEGSSELKNINDILHLDVLELYDTAYSRLPLVKRLLIVVFGRYSRYLERFTGHRKLKKTKAAKSKRNKSQNRQSKSYSSDSYSSSGYSYSGKRSRKSSIDTPPKPKHYNKDQRDNAWSSLGNEIYKKKGT